MINTVYFEKGSNFANVYNLYQWDYGQSLEIKGLDIHDNVWVQFAMNPYGGEAIPVVTKVNDGVITANIPAFVFEKGTVQNYNAYAFVYVSNAESGETVKVIKLNIKARPKPEDYVYTEPEKQRYEILENLIKSFLNSNGEIDPKKIPDMYYKEDGLVNTIKEEYLGLDWVPKIRVNNVEIFKEQKITVTNENNVGNKELYLYDLWIDQDTRKKIINEYDSLTLVLDGNKIELPYVERFEEDGYVNEAIFTINPFNQQGAAYEGTVLVGAGKNATMQVILTLGEHTLEVRHINVTPNPLPAELLTDGTPYLEKTFSEILPEMTAETSDLYGGEMRLPIGLELFEGDEYNVKWQGKEYDCKCFSIEIDGVKINVLGDAYTLSGGEVGKEATGEPFCFFIYPKEIQGMINASGSCTPVPHVSNETFTFSIDGYKKKLRKLPEECLPDSIKELLNGSLPNIKVDSELSKTSTNPVQNKVVAEAVKKLSEEIDDLKDESVKSVNGFEPNEDGEVEIKYGRNTEMAYRHSELSEHDKKITVYTNDKYVSTPHVFLGKNYFPMTKHVLERFTQHGLTLTTDQNDYTIKGTATVGASFALSYDGTDKYWELPSDINVGDSLELYIFGVQSTYTGVYVKVSAFNADKSRINFVQRRIAIGENFYSPAKLAIKEGTKYLTFEFAYSAGDSFDNTVFPVLVKTGTKVLNTNSFTDGILEYTTNDSTTDICTAPYESVVIYNQDLKEYIDYGSSNIDLSQINNNTFFVTPQDYGAVADGYTDDTVAIQSAIDSGKKVYFPKAKSSYFFTSINLPENTRIEIDGALSTKTDKAIKILGTNVEISGNGRITYSGSGSLFYMDISGKEIRNTRINVQHIQGYEFSVDSETSVAVEISLGGSQLGTCFLTHIDSNIEEFNIGIWQHDETDTNINSWSNGLYIGGSIISCTEAIKIEASGEGSTIYSAIQPKIVGSANMGIIDKPLITITGNTVVLSKMWDFTSQANKYSIRCKGPYNALLNCIQYLEHEQSEHFIKYDDFCQYTLPRRDDLIRPRIDAQYGSSPNNLYDYNNILLNADKSKDITVDYNNINCEINNIDAIFSQKNVCVDMMKINESEDAVFSVDIDFSELRTLKTLCVHSETLPDSVRFEIYDANGVMLDYVDRLLGIDYENIQGSLNHALWSYNYHKHHIELGEILEARIKQVKIIMSLTNSSSARIFMISGRDGTETFVPKNGGVMEGELVLKSGLSMLDENGNKYKLSIGADGQLSVTLDDQ